MNTLFQTGRLFLFFLLLFSTARAEGPPNVVMIISDDQAWIDYGFMGHEVIQTPRLDQLARESTVFTRGYVPSSLCRPSLMTMITGLYPFQHRVTGNDPVMEKGDWVWDRALLLSRVQDLPTVPKLLGERGYLSHQSGKWWEGNYRLGGFTAGMTHGDLKRGGRHGDEGLKIGREGLQPIFDFLQQADGKPFFLWYAPFLPHQPHNPPQRLLEKYTVPGRSVNVAKYYAMCQWFDETCGELLDYLDNHDLRENTLVVYVCDNGWIQLPGKLPGQEGYAPRSKRSPNEGGIRTPIMFRWPGHIEPHRDDTTLVHTIDLAPTMLAACGVKAPEAMPGANLLPVCNGQPLQRSAIFGDVYAHNITELENPLTSLRYRWCIEDDWKLIVDYRTGAQELYHLADDPTEQTNLVGDEPGIVERLEDRLRAWWKAGSRKSEE